MRSGLRSSFSRPRKTNGATAKDVGGFQTPTENHADFSSPAVRSNYEHARFYGTRHAHDLYDTQVRTARHMRRPASPASSAQPSTSGGGAMKLLHESKIRWKRRKGFQFLVSLYWRDYHWPRKKQWKRGGSRQI